MERPIGRRDMAGFQVKRKGGALDWNAGPDTPILFLWLTLRTAPKLPPDG
jgi:hypothetical protein